MDMWVQQRLEKNLELVELVMRNGLAAAGTFFKKVMGRKTLKWWKCSGDTVGTLWRHSGDTVATQWRHSGDAVATQWGHIRCIQRLTLEYEKLGTTVRTVEEEWKAFKDTFVGIAELCGRTSGKGDHYQEGKIKCGGQKT